MIRELRPALVVFALLTLVTGVVYPARDDADRRGRVPEPGQRQLSSSATAGSSARGCSASRSRSPQYFWSRPSATGPMPYNGAVSSGSNQGPMNPALADAVAGRIAALRERRSRQHAPVPVDLVTASGSGLDPHISSPRPSTRSRASPARAACRRPRCAALVASTREGRTFGVLGEPRVNVLALNLALDALE